MLSDALVCIQAWQKADKQVVNLQRSVCSPLSASGKTVIVHVWALPLYSS